MTNDAALRQNPIPLELEQLICRSHSGKIKIGAKNKSRHAGKAPITMLLGLTVLASPTFH